MQQKLIRSWSCDYARAMILHVLSDLSVNIWPSQEGTMPFAWQVLYQMSFFGMYNEYDKEESQSS